jgi:hypothetical protein
VISRGIEISHGIKSLMSFSGNWIALSISRAADKNFESKALFGRCIEQELAVGFFPFQPDFGFERTNLIEPQCRHVVQF